MGRGGNAQPESGSGIDTDETGVNLLLFENHFAVLHSVKKRLISISGHGWWIKQGTLLTHSYHHILCQNELSNV